MDDVADRALRAAVLVSGWCAAKWGADYSQNSDMFSHCVDMFAGYRGGGSAKHVDELDAINSRLGLPDGSGVFWYHAFDDGSRVFLTCPGQLAVLDDKGLRWVNGEGR